MMTASTLPGRFEARLDADPFAAAITLRRNNGGVRVWSRAAVEHRAVRIGALCVSAGLDVSARVAVKTTGVLDTMAATWFTLATGRVLATAEMATFVIDDALIAHSKLPLGQSYKVRSFVLPQDPALAFRDEVIDHAALLALVDEPRFTPLLPVMTWNALRHLDAGEPIEVAAPAGRGSLARRAISAA